MKLSLKLMAEAPQFRRLFRVLLTTVSTFKLKKGLAGSLAWSTWISRSFNPLVSRYSTFDSSLWHMRQASIIISWALVACLWSLVCILWRVLVQIHCQRDLSRVTLVFPALKVLDYSCLTMQSEKKHWLLSSICVSAAKMLDSTSWSCMWRSSTMAPIMIEAVCPLRCAELNYWVTFFSNPAKVRSNSTEAWIN